MKRRERPPVLAVAAGSVAALFFVLPLAGLLWRAPWRSVVSDLGAPEVRKALRLSLEASLSATAVCLAFGLPLAWVLARMEFPGRRLLRALTVLPMVLPPVVGGIALIFAFGRRGIVGQYLDRWFGIAFAFTTKGVILAEAFVAMPFLVVTAEAAFRSLDRNFEDAARTLGASRWTVFRRVTLPLAGPALGGGGGALLGAGAGRVRCHHHLRRQLPRDDPDHAAGRVPVARVVAAGDGYRPQPGAAARVAGRPRRSPGPVAGGVLS